MALGGGSWTAQNKVLPGTYVNFSSVIRSSSSLSERGYVAAPFVLEWGPENQVFVIKCDDLRKDSLQLLGHDYTDDALRPQRELFRSAQTLYAYRLNTGGEKASNKFATAKYTGVVGNRLSIVIAANVDNETFFDVSTYYDNLLLDVQTVQTASELVDNDFVSFASSATIEETAKTPLAGGTNGSVTAGAYQNFLDKIESYSFHALVCPSDDTTTIQSFVNYTKRMRDEIGAKFQTVIYNASGSASLANYEGIVAVGNSASSGKAYDLVYWVAGAIAGCPINSSNTNRLYDGECEVETNYTQTDLEKAIRNGRFMLHNVNGEVRVLEDINSLTTLTEMKGEILKSNQTIRVCDQIANDIAVLFNTRYVGRVPNDEAGRVSLWNDICKILQSLETVRAIENFDTDDVVLEQGTTKKAVACTISDLNIINAMAQLYLSVIIR